MKVPSDNEIMTEKYKQETGGCCGQACLAVIEGITIKEVMDNWSKLGLIFKGWSGWKQLKEYLQKRGYEVQQERYDKNKFWNMEKHFIARVQWIGDKENKEKPFYGWEHWSQASANTHFIVVNEEKVFCNETGIFNFSELHNYLKENRGVITSLFSVSKK